MPRTALRCGASANLCGARWRAPARRNLTAAVLNGPPDPVFASTRYAFVVRRGPRAVARSRCGRGGASRRCWRGQIALRGVLACAPCTRGGSRCVLATSNSFRSWVDCTLGRSRLRAVHPRCASMCPCYIKFNQLRQMLAKVGLPSDAFDNLQVLGPSWVSPGLWNFGCRSRLAF